MSKILIAVMTCKRDRWRVPYHRKMLEGHGADVRFFMGAGNYDAISPEILLPCSDAYDQLIHKDAWMFRWFREYTEYGQRSDRPRWDYVFKIDSDTFVDVSRLVTANLTDDWAGLMGDEGRGGGKAHCTSGGVGIWLSLRAVNTFLEYYDGEDKRHPTLPPGKIQYWDDWCLSWMLAEKGVVPRHEIRFWNGDMTARLGWQRPADFITYHGWSPDNRPEDRSNVCF